MNIFKGILSPKLASKLRDIAETEDENLIADKIFNYTIKYRTRILYVLIFYLLWHAGNLLILYFSSYFIKFQISQRILLVFIFLFVLVLGSFLIDLRHLVVTNKVNRIVGNLFGKFLDLIIDRYRLSLAEKIPNLPETEFIAKSLEESFFAFLSLVRFYTSFLGNILGVLIITLVSFVQGERPPYSLLALVILMVLLYRLQVFFAKRFHSKTQKTLKIVDKIGSKLRDTKPLITKTKLDLEGSRYFNNMEQVVETTSKINITHKFLGDFLPFIFFIFPVLSGENIIIPIVAASIIINYLSSTYNITNAYKLSISQERIGEIKKLLETIDECTEELTNKKYKKFSKNICKKTYTKKTYTNGSDVDLKNLVYKVGREGMVADIEVPEMHLPHKKISILYAKSGTGKSILGRLITMRYSAFEADFIGKDCYDFRCFNNLDEAQDTLILSEHKTPDFSLGMKLNLWHTLDVDFGYTF